MRLWLTKRPLLRHGKLYLSRDVGPRWLTGTERSSTLFKPEQTVQFYKSTSDNPFLNLAVEQYLLEESAADSTILYFYTNRPCVVIGRNQNPWLEANLNALNKSFHSNTTASSSKKLPSKVDLVRRRSGGGTVFHDLGNINWSIICPKDEFTRDRSAELVVRGLRDLGVERARVNTRHDIVLDQGKARDTSIHPEDLHRTVYTSSEQSQLRPKKVSGSAYKITRQRALHHATCLLSSQYLEVIPMFLRSPAKNYITARGVESVSSPVTNVGISIEEFQEAVYNQFNKRSDLKGQLHEVQFAHDEALTVSKVAKFYEELQQPDWLFDQTPRFTFRYSRESTGAIAIHGVSDSFATNIEVDRGVVTSAAMSLSDSNAEAKSETNAFNNITKGLRLRDDWKWEEIVREITSRIGSRADRSRELIAVANWLQENLPTGPTLLR